MEEMQSEVLRVLLKAVYARGLISRAAYSGAEDLLYAGMDLPELFRLPAHLAQGGCSHGCTQDPPGDAGGQECL